MPSQEDIDAQQELLATHRRTLIYLLKQQANFDSGHAPVHIANGIDDARTNIRRVKKTLRDWGEDVEDHPDDEGHPFINLEPLPPTGLPSDPQPGIPVKSDLTIIIPIFNESRIIEDLIKSLKSESLIEKYPIILCDDCSTDNSFVIMQKHSRGIKNVQCIREESNTRKVGAIKQMAGMAETPFVLTLDADSILSELEENALDKLIERMQEEDIAACCFRIVPNDRNVLSRLQKLDYIIFSDAIRRILKIPICLIGQGVLWKTDSLLKVLSQHTGEFDGDDLENTIIALEQGMKIFWEDKTIILKTNPKHTVVGLIKQRALSWDFGLLRVLFRKKALRLGGNSGAFYKNILLLDFFAHPLKLIAIPILISVPIINWAGSAFYRGDIYDIYRTLSVASFRYGAFGIILIWLISVANSIICVRRNFGDIVKWTIFNGIYLSSPFVYFAYQPLLYTRYINVYDIFGATIHWLGLGLLTTYLWWVMLALFLLSKSSLERKFKTELVSIVFILPLYYFLLLVICRTIGIVKYLATRIGLR